MIFDYRAKDEQGVVKKGVIEATSPLEASEILHSHGLVVLSIGQNDSEFSIEKYIPFLNHISSKELVLFSRQLSTLINAKMPIIQALEILHDQVSSKKLKEVLADVSEDIQGGKSLSAAISRFPQVFSNLYINLVKAGELSGTLDQALVYLADQQEKDYDLVAKIRGAMIYPAFIISSILIVGGLMFVFVLPQMIAVLKEAGAQLPITTRILIFLTEILQSYWIVILLFLIGSIVGTRFYIRSLAGRVIWDSLKLKLPIFGKLLQKIYMDRFARNLSTLLAGGIPIVTALHTVAEIVGNSVYKNIILDAANEVETGKSIAGVLAREPMIPPILSQMIKVGEQTGSLDEVLSKLAKFYDKEVEGLLSTLTTLLEPMIMILLGLAVAIMVAGILLPIYNLASVQ